MSRIGPKWCFIYVGLLWLSALTLSPSLYSQVANPFNVVRTNLDSTAHLATPSPIAAPIISDDLDNPFNVDHIPIRKNQYQEIERLAVNRNAAEENISLASLPLWVIILSMCLLAYMLFIKKDHLSVLIKSMTNDSFMRMTNYEENSGRSLVYMLGYSMYLLNIALFIYLLLLKLFDVQVVYLYPKILLFVFIFFIGKHIVNTFFSWVFYVSKESLLQDFNIISIYNIVGLIFLIINILILFGPDIWLRSLAVIGIAIFILFLLSRYYKTLRIGQKYLNSHFFHFFLYFCAFEISPWVIVYTVLKDLF